MKKPLDTNVVVPIAVDKAAFSNDLQVDEYYELNSELDELIDEARDYLLNNSANSKAELIEVLRRDHLRVSGDHNKWTLKLPLVRQAVSIAFDDAITSGEILPLSKKSWPKPRPFDLTEIESAQSTPDCIVEDYLYADVALLPAPGGFGKTTLMLFEAACIAFGTDTLYGKRILKSGPVVIITAEDGREQMAARLREIILENGLLARQSQIIKNLYICDVAGLGMKLTEVEKDVVVQSSTVETLIQNLSSIRPVLVIIDPAVSFGVGESRVNDAEQGLIETARAIRNSVGCCVRFVHHTGKQNARDGAVDQYAGRGGSAFSDGARMVHVLSRMSNADWYKATGKVLKSNESALRLVLPKMSFTKSQPEIYIRRTGFRFEAIPFAINGEQMVEEMIYQLIIKDFEIGKLRSIKSVEDDDQLGSITRAQRRSAIKKLLNDPKKLVSRTPPNGKGRAQYLHPTKADSTDQETSVHPAATPGELKEEIALPTLLQSPPNSPLLNAPPYRTGSGGELADATTQSDVLNHAAIFGEIRRVGDMSDQGVNFEGV